MKTIFSGEINLYTEIENGEHVAYAVVNGSTYKAVSNREYAAIAELFSTLKTVALEKAKNTKETK